MNFLNNTKKVNIMSKRISNILLLSIAVTIFGFLMDDDAKEESTIMRFVEFFAMSAIIFIIFSLIHHFINLTKKKIQITKN